MAESETINLSRSKFLVGVAVTAMLVYALGLRGVTSPAWIATELILTILGLFFLGSFKYQLDKNALTYGMAGLIIATFIPQWWPSSGLRMAITQDGALAFWHFSYQHFLTLEGLEALVHADTMLFILGLTYFVAVIAQTRLLETISGKILRKQNGKVLPTVALLAGLVAVSSGILDGVSMIGLMIRTLVIILALGHADTRDIIFAVIVSTVITTVSGMWMAYGEPPNLIMKANLYPHLDNVFFLKYCLPVAMGSYGIVVWNLRKRLGKRKIDLNKQDILDEHIADVRFLQASRHGEVYTPPEFVEQQRKLLGKHYIVVHERVLRGEPIGEALIHEDVPLAKRRALLGHYVTEDLADELEEHYQFVLKDDTEAKDESVGQIRAAIKAVSLERRKAQDLGALAFIPFIGLLIAHGLDHELPLFVASGAGFAAASLAVLKNPKMRTLAFTEARHEYKEYLFLFPLFLSITLLQKTGFFESLAQGLKAGIERYGVSHVAYMQYWGACLLSAILDNNVVADFASKALHGLHLGTLYIFSAAQIAGYAVGGCWTHIGCAQSVVAFAFIRKEISPRYTPVEWMKAMTRVILEMSLMVTAFVYLGSWLLSKIG